MRGSEVSTVKATREQIRGFIDELKNEKILECSGRCIMPYLVEGVQIPQTVRVPEQAEQLCFAKLWPYGHDNITNTNPPHK